MKVGDKIKKLRKQHRMTQSDLAKKLNVAPTAVSAWEGNKNRPLMDKISIIADMFDVPITYFFDGAIEEDKNIKVAENESSYLYNTDLLVKLPIVGTISCGNGIIAYEDIEGLKEVPRSWVKGSEHFLLRAKGDSMINARIEDGDLLLIRKQEIIENGEIAAVVVDDEAVLKRIYRTDGQIILQSENPKYPPKFINSQSDIRIIGKLKMNIISY